MTWLFALGYLAGAIITVRLMVKWTTETWSYLGWEGEDTILALCIAAVWPLGLPILRLGFWFENYRGDPLTRFLSRLADRDRAKHRDNL